MALRLPEVLRPAAEAIATELLESASAAGARVYATVDLASVEDAQAWLALLDGEGKGRNLFASQPEEVAVSLAAWLLDLGDAAGHDARLLDYSVAQAMLSDSVTWVVGALPPDEMAVRLSRRLTARLPEGDALFRYYDPRLLPVVHEAWSETPAHAFFALGSRWHFLDAALQLRCVSLAEPGDVDAFAPPMPVSAEQHRRLQAVSELHQWVRFLGLRKPGRFFRIAPGDRLAFVAAQRAHAEACGVVRFADVLRYCELALEHGDDFHQEPGWQSVWDEMRASESSLADAVAKVEGR